MARKKQAKGSETAAGANGDGPPPSFAELWDQVEPGTRTSHGVYSIYKTKQGSLLISYRAEGTGEDQHLELPPFMVQLMGAAQDGKLSPMDAARLALRRFGSGG